MRDFKKLAVWQKAHAFTLVIYRVTEHFPADERYGLVRQLRAAAASIPTNITEGYARRADTELAHFLNIAMASAAEVEYHLILASDLGYILDNRGSELGAALQEIQRMLVALHTKVRAELPRRV